MKRKQAGFSLVEIMVAVTISIIIAGVVITGLSKTTEVSRDSQRKADLSSLQVAIELYKQNEGRYPLRCPVTGQSWSGQKGSNFECDDGTGEYIRDLAPKYIPALPIDPVSPLSNTNSGYVYTVNTDGTVYKIMARNTVESEVVDYDHEYKSCDATHSAWAPTCKETEVPPETAADAGLDRCDVGVCDRTDPGDNKKAHCQENNAQFKASYGLWGGYASGPANTPPGIAYDRIVEDRTEDIICDIP